MKVRGGFLTGTVMGCLMGCHGVPHYSASEISMSNARVSEQLIAGFHGMEEHRYRWTSRSFSVGLRPPPGASQSGARVQLSLFIPQSQIQKLGAMTLRADADQCDLAPQTYTHAGSYEYIRNISPSCLKTSYLPLIFNFDKSILPRESDGRELAAVVTRVALSTKN